MPTRLLTIGLLFFPLTAWAQGGAPEDRLFLPLDAEAPADFKRADGLAERKQWDRVVTELDRLLMGGGAKLIEREGGYVTIRSEARRRLLALPPEGKRAYALTHEDPARRLYERGLDTPGAILLEELLAIHPASALASKARELLISRYFERGEPGAALIHVEALLASVPSISDQTRLTELRVLCLAVMGRQSEAELGVDELDLAPEQADALRTQVHSLRPTPPNAPPAEGSPLAWSRRVFGYYAEDAERAPWSLPRSDASWVYVHDGSHAQAIDSWTGKLAWRTPLSAADAFLRPRGLCRLALAQRMVVCVLPGSDGGLVGLERQTGRLLWRRDLAGLKKDAEIDFPAHLSGRPEVVGGVVAVSLVTDHQDKEVHTLAVDVETGELAWTAFLASQNGGRAPLPYLTQGLQRLYVVTGLGAVAALDLSGEVQWLRRYKSKRDDKPEGAGPFPPGFGRMPGQGQPTGPQERDPTAVVSRGVLWAAPGDGVGFMAWNARTGEPRAKLTVPAGGRVLAARGAGVLVLSEQGDLFDVTRAGAKLVQQVGGSLVARPHVYGDHVFIPRADGVVGVDLARKTVASFTDWEASGGEGNLLVANGRLMVAAHRGVFAYGRKVAEGREAPTPALQLASNDYQQREAGSATLRGHGEEVRAELEELSQSVDPEVQLRARVVLGELDRVARMARWSPLIKDAWKAQIKDLLNRLTHPNPEVRLAALRRMGAIRDDDVTVLFHELLADEDERVAFNAAITLLARDDRSGIDHVASTLREGAPADRLTAVTVLGQAGLVEDLPLLTPALSAKGANVRAATVQAMLRLGKHDALELVLPSLDDPEDEVRLAVLVGIQENGIDVKEAVQALAKAAQDTNDLIRETAIDALVNGRLRHPDVFLALGMALGDDVQRIAKRAGNRLFKMAQKVNDDVLMIPPAGIERGARLEDSILRGYAAQIAMLFASEQLARAQAQAERAEQMEAEGHHASRSLSVETLTRFMSDSNPRIRGLKIVGGPGWGGLLLTRTEGAVLSKADVAAINSLTLDLDQAVRHNGYLALTKALDAPGRGRILAGALADHDEQIREKAIDWLIPSEGGDLLDTEGAAKVIALSARTAEGDPPGASEAQTVLDRIPAERVPALLTPVLRGWPDEAVRARAGERLAASTGGAVVYDPSVPAGNMADQFQIWAWRETHPGKNPEDILLDLTALNPTVRWKAAQAAAELPLPLIRNGVIASLGTERLDWVLKTKLEAAVAITGQTLGFHAKLKGQGLRDCAAEFQRWLGRTLAAEARNR